MWIAILIVAILAIVGCTCTVVLLTQKKEPSIQPVSEAENKSVDEVPTEQEEEVIEPKFKVGDWIISEDAYKSILIVEKVFSADYGLRDLDGNYGEGFIVECDARFKLWTIEDAKNGDVLYTKGGIGYEKKDIVFIFKGIGSRDYLDEPCIDHYCYLCEDGFYVNTTGFMGVLSDHIKQDTCPATKEQRDLLLQKMKEAGYEWDAEKKELKKIEQLPKPTLDKPDMQEPAPQEPAVEEPKNEEFVEDVISETPKFEETEHMNFDQLVKAFSEYIEIPYHGKTESHLAMLYEEAVTQFSKSDIILSRAKLPLLYKQELFPNVTDEIWGNKKDEGAAYNTMMGWLFALQLAELKPKKRNQIFKVGYELGGYTYGTPVYGFEFRSDPNVARLVASIIYVGMRGKLNPDIAAMRAEVGGTSYPYGLSYYLDLGLNHLKTADDIQKNVVSKGGFYVDFRQFFPSSAGPYDKNYKERPEHVMEALVIDSYKNIEWDKCLHEHIVKTYNLDSTDPEIHQATVQAIADKEQSTNHLYGKNKSFNGYHFHPVFGLDTIGKEIPTAGATANLTFSIQAIATYFRLILQNKVDNPAYYGRLRPGCDWTQEKKKNSDTDDRRNVLVDIAIEDNDGQKTSGYGYYDTDGYYKHTEVEREQYAEAQKNHLGANSYPSGHSSGIWCVAMMLVELMPDKADLIMKEANQFAINRTITRFHWTSDTIFGRVLGSAANAMCHATSDYDIQLKLTRKELES